MRVAGYGDVAVHCHHHRVLATHLSNLMLSELAAPRAGTAFITKVATVLEMWIFNHFMSEDPRVRSALRQFAERRSQLRFG